MAFMDIEIVHSALKTLRGMQPAKAADIRTALAQIASDPLAPNNNLRPLRGVPGGFRLRVGDWRVSYTFDPRGQKIRVFEIAPRGSAYR